MAFRESFKEKARSEADKLEVKSRAEQKDWINASLKHHRDIITGAAGWEFIHF